jgi:WhiB family redox-sensing transcriptional regulator
VKIEDMGMTLNSGAGHGIRNRPKITALSNGEEAEAMYDQHVIRERQGETPAHLSAVSDAPQTDFDAGAAQRVGEEAPVNASVPVDAGAAYVGGRGLDLVPDESVGQVSDDVDGDIDDGEHLAVVLREAERPTLMAIPGFDQMFEEIEDQWQERALCAQTDPEAFFPEKGGSTREAKRICLGCDVKDECLEYALANDERFGIWGGLSERERRRLKRGIV